MTKEKIYSSLSASVQVFQVAFSLNDQQEIVSGSYNSLPIYPRSPLSTCIYVFFYQIRYVAEYQLLKRI